MPIKSSFFILFLFSIGVDGEICKELAWQFTQPILITYNQGTVTEFQLTRHWCRLQSIPQKQD